ncbi:hypothetical protein A3Q56_07949 [Intoshia linei]|uniref:Uncharacterized protein n=1 Tax=Intoshia linei TaxID=1819745 RepID=A0A177AR93_9BILA|nr:hypothetical protein A3Q56_07949 [Intoshia linei]
MIVLKNEKILGTIITPRKINRSRRTNKSLLDLDGPKGAYAQKKTINRQIKGEIDILLKEGYSQLEITIKIERSRKIIQTPLRVSLSNKISNQIGCPVKRSPSDSRLLIRTASNFPLSARLIKSNLIV